MIFRMEQIPMGLSKFYYWLTWRESTQLTLREMNLWC